MQDRTFIIMELGPPLRQRGSYLTQRSNAAGGHPVRGSSAARIPRPLRAKSDANYAQKWLIFSA